MDNTNDITNILKVLGKTSDVLEVMSIFLNSEREVSFNHIIPLPVELTKNPYLNNPKYTSWTLDNWGTVFEASETSILAPNEVMFKSVGLIPDRLLETLSIRFPKVKFQLSFADEDLGFNVGDVTFMNGGISSLTNYANGSIEAYERSMEITGDFHYIKGFICDLLEEECDEEFPKMCIEMAYNNRSLDIDFPPYILSIFESMAVKDEDYEFASSVKRISDK